MIKHKLKKMVPALHAVMRMMEQSCRIQEMGNRFGFQNTSTPPVTPDITPDATTTITHEITTTIHMDPIEGIITMEKEAFSKKTRVKRMLNTEKLFLEELKKMILNTKTRKMLVQTQQSSQKTISQTMDMNTTPENPLEFKTFKN